MIPFAPVPGFQSILLWFIFPLQHNPRNFYQEENVGGTFAWTSKLWPWTWACSFPPAPRYWAAGDTGKEGIPRRARSAVVWLVSSGWSQRVPGGLPDKVISSSRQAGGPTDTCTAFCGVFILQNCVLLEAHHSSCHFYSWSQKRPQNSNLRNKMKKKGIFHLNVRYLCYRMSASWLLKAAEFVLGFSPGKRGIPGQHLYFYFPPHWGKGQFGFQKMIVDPSSPHTHPTLHGTFLVSDTCAEATSSLREHSTQELPLNSQVCSTATCL